MNRRMGRLRARQLLRYLGECRRRWDRPSAMLGLGERGLHRVREQQPTAFFRAAFIIFIYNRLYSSQTYATDGYENDQSTQIGSGQRQARDKRKETLTKSGGCVLQGRALRWVCDDCALHVGGWPRGAELERAAGVALVH